MRPTEDNAGNHYEPARNLDQRARGARPGAARGSRHGGIEFALSLAAGVVALAGTGPGSASLDVALGASYSEAARMLLVAVGVLGALVALAIPRVVPVKSPPPAPPR